MKNILGYLSLLACLSLMACSGASVALPENDSTNFAALQLFRQGDATPRDVLAGVYPGDVVHLEVRGRRSTQPLIWSSSNIAMGTVSPEGVLTIHQAGEFQVQVQDDAYSRNLRVRAGAERPFTGEALSPAPGDPNPMPSPSVSPLPTATPEVLPEPSASPQVSPSPSPAVIPSPLPEATPEVPASVPSDPFVDEVVSFQPGLHAGFGADKLPGIVLGAPQGSGTGAGSFHVLSLGIGGQIILKSATPILDGAGADFIVFENAFFAGGNPSAPFAEPAEVAVSQDGLNFVAFACDPGNSKDLYPGCAGVHPVFANSETNGIDPTDPAQAGGDAFNLSELGLTWAQWIRIKDLSSSGGGLSAGFDLDAIGIVHQ